MKTIMVIIFFLILNIKTFGQSHRFIVEGNISGKTDGIMALSFTGRDIDTVQVLNGKFRFEKPVEESKAYFLYFYSKVPIFKGLYLFISPGDTIYIDAKVKAEKEKINFFEKDTTILLYKFVDYQINGGKYLKDFTEYVDSRSSFKNAILYKKWTKAKKAGNTKEVNIITNEMMRPTLDYIIVNPKSELSAFFLYDLKEFLSKDSLIRFSKGLDSSLNGYYYKIEIERYVNSKNNGVVIPKHTLVKGEHLPSINLRLIDGSNLSLDNIKEKLIILDFWGSWCMPCIRDLPHMIEFYEKYRQNGIEFISIACRDSLQSATSIIDKYGLKWPQAINSEQNEDIALKLGIRNYPTKIIIGRDGKIIDIIIGLSKETPNSIEKILSKH